MFKLLIWGMGKYTHDFLKKVSLFKCDIEFVGITTSDITKSNGDKFMNIPILSVEDWCNTQADFRVVCSLTHQQEIMMKIKSIISPNCFSLILNTDEFYSQIYLYDDEIKIMHNKLLENNLLYRFFYEKQHTLLTKWFHYFDIYDRWFSRYRGKEIVFCEVGVFKGGSVQMWREYFGEKATIIGIDINEECKKYEEDNIHIEIGSQDDVNFWHYIKNKYPHIDILLDDGGHFMEQQIITFEEMFAHIANGGIYMCEDAHTSYIELFGGGYKKESTYIEYTKNIIDDINAYHIVSDQEHVNYNTRNIAGIHYYDSIVVIEKKKQLFPFSIIRDKSEEQ